jgi:hypothetical protein
MGKHYFKPKFYEPSHLEIVVRIEGRDVIYATGLKGRERDQLLDDFRATYGPQNVRALTQQERNTLLSGSGRRAAA